jgi:glutaredoxin
MENNKKYIGMVIVAFLVVGIIVWGSKQEKANAPTVSNGNTENQNQASTSEEIIYYYRYDCSHCTELSKFLDDNKIAEKVNFSKKEIHDKVNGQELQKRAAECNIPTDQIGVPFVWARGKCIIGTPPAEEFFKQEAGL